MPQIETILVAEDDTDDAFFLKRAFAKVGVRTSLQFVRDGQEAVQYLRGEGQFADRLTYPFPHLLLLDLKMPRMDGLQVLGWVRLQPFLKRLPAVIFSSSAHEKDINNAYDLGANSYLVKPHNPADLLALVNKLKTYWCETNKSPGAFAKLQ